jgi:hypothetical protein
MEHFPIARPRSSPRRGLFCFLLQARLGQYDLPFVCPCGDGVGEILVNVGAAATSALPFAGATRNFVRLFLQVRTFFPAIIALVLADVVGARP